MNNLPGLPRTQRNAISARANERFQATPVAGVDFSNMKTGNLYILTLRYTHGFTPSVLLQQDVFTMFGGGYAQDHVLVSVAKIVRKVSADILEVELEKPVNMSHKCGPTVESDRFALHRDGHVMFFSDDEAENWSSYQPRWEHTRFPVLPVVVCGCDIVPDHVGARG